jgi:PAS domain S-box-containing protein
MLGPDAFTLASIIESAEDAIIAKTLDAVITLWNPGAERLFGYAAREVLGRPITVLFPADRLSEEDEFQRRIRAGERVEHFETVRLRKDGSPVSVSVTLSPIRDRHGRIVGISKFARDITLQKRLEGQRRAQEELLRITLASIADAVITTDTEGRVTFVNPVGEALTGWSGAAAAGEPLERVFHIVNERTGQPAPNPVRRVLSDGIIVGLANHTVLVARDGTRRPIDDSAAPIHDDRGQLFGTVLVFRDVTARRRTEADLQRLAAIVESSDDAIVSKTLDGIVTSWNAGAERTFGYPAAEMLGRSITLLFPADRLAEEADLLARIARGERVEHFETVRIRRDGGRIQVSVTLSPLRDTDGEIVGASKIVRDISERVRLVAQERHARAEAEHANRLKDEFLATLSHELRTPLTSIYGWTRMLQTGQLAPERASHALEVIMRNARAQLDLITELLDVSRITMGRVNLDVRSLDFAEIVRAAVDGIRPASTAKDLTLELICEPGTPPVTGDPERLQQVVWNLVTNAVKFSHRSGRIEIRVHRSGPTVDLTVRDSGIGIAPDVLPHVFDRFRQADSSTTRAYGGLGLGLSIVRHIVELHGGTVAATSEGVGRGASFTVRLPLAEGAPPALPTAAEVDTLRPTVLAGVTIVVVEDELDTLELVATVLRHAGAVVTTASSVADAMTLTRRARPDVIVADLAMPGEGGFELLDRLRHLSEPERARIPVLALSAYTRDLDRTRAAGFAAYLTKPVEPSALVRVVADLLGAGQA